MTALILLTCLLLAGPVDAASPKAGKSAATKDPLASLKPPATPEERELFKTVKGTAAVRAFLITRQFVREAEAKPDSPPPMPKEFDFRHTLSINEQLRFFDLSMSGKLPTEAEMAEREKPAPTLSEEAAAPLKVLDPPATKEERDLFVPIHDKPAEVEKFLIARKFAREFKANPRAVPPRGMSFQYAVSIDEQLQLMKAVLEPVANGAPK